MQRRDRGAGGHHPAAGDRGRHGQIRPSYGQGRGRPHGPAAAGQDPERVHQPRGLTSRGCSSSSCSAGRTPAGPTTASPWRSIAGRACRSPTARPGGTTATASGRTGAASGSSTPTACGIPGGRARGGEGTEPPTEALSWFRWNGFLFDSFQSGYLKKLNYRIYRKLEQQAAKRLYRYLDKHFYEPHRVHLEFDLQMLAFEHLGMSRRYDSTQIRRALQPAIEELEGIGFIEQRPAESRYKRLARGRWQVEFSKRLGDQAGKRKPQTSPQPACKTSRADRGRRNGASCRRPESGGVSRVPEHRAARGARASGFGRCRPVLAAKLRVEKRRGGTAV